MKSIEPDFQDFNLCTPKSGLVFHRNTILPQSIGAVRIVYEGKAPTPYGKSYASKTLVQLRFRGFEQEQQRHLEIPLIRQFNPLLSWSVV